MSQCNKHLLCSRWWWQASRIDSSFKRLFAVFLSHPCQTHSIRLKQNSPRLMSQYSCRLFIQFPLSHAIEHYITWAVDKELEHNQRLEQTPLGEPKISSKFWFRDIWGLPLRRKLRLSPRYSILTMEAAGLSTKLVTTYVAFRNHSPEDRRTKRLMDDI